MSGSDYSNESDYVYKVGEPCWIFVNSVNSPSGRWRGEIVEFNGRSCEANGYSSVVAKITDERCTENNSWFIGRSPTVNYSVMPRNAHTTAFIELLEKAEADALTAARRTRIREEAFKEALAVVGTRTTDDVQALLKASGKVTSVGYSHGFAEALRGLGAAYTRDFTEALRELDVVVKKLTA